MPEAVMTNAPEARSETGELLDQASTTPATTPTETPPSGETKAPPAAKAPEAYTEFKVPDGVKLEGEALTAATALFKDLGLAQAGAQKLVDYHAAQVKAALDAPTKTMNDMYEGWKSAAEADPDIGPASGAKAAKIKENIGRAFNAVGDETLVNEFKSMLNLTGLGDHPAVIKVLNKWAESIIEPRNVTGGGPARPGQLAPGATDRPSAAKALYPTLSG